MNKLITTGYNNKAEYYDKYRWRYSVAAIQRLINKIGINNSSIIADIGSGTGILSEHFTSIADKIYLVEPNEEMRSIANKRFSVQKNVISINGTSGRTQIKSDEIDLIIAGHSVNWFDYESTISEFQRILKDDGWIAFVKNRIISSTIEDYIGELHSEEFGYKIISSSINTKTEYEYLTDNSCEIDEQFSTKQNIDEFIGSLISASFFPTEGGDKYDDFLQKANEIFTKGSINGFIDNIVETKIIYGRIKQ